VLDGPADLIGAAFQRHPVELIDRQRDEQLDARLDLPAGVAKRPLAPIFRALDGGGVGDVPMRRDRIARRATQSTPNTAELLQFEDGGLIAAAGACCGR
jgi:hypothetical protein